MMEAFGKVLLKRASFQLCEKVTSQVQCFNI